jgi:hypothetical protein
MPLLAPGRMTMRRFLPFFIALAAMAAEAETPALPEVSAPLAETPTSHALLSAAHLKRPLDLAKYGYIETEYLVSGQARVFDWPENAKPSVLAAGPYTTRILVRRPKDHRRFSGVAILEPLNPSADIDLPIMWAESHEQFMADGHAWIGLTIKPNTIKALKNFDPVRYATVAMPNPRPAPACGDAQINPLSRPTTTADETGLAWDMISQAGVLLKSQAKANPLGRPASRVYMSGQSQTAGYARTYASVFGKDITTREGRPLFDAYLYSGSPPWQVPLHQCREDLPEGDPRLITAAAGVPVIEMFTQGDMGTNIQTRRADSDGPADLFRRYEIAGAAHVDPWEQYSFAADADTRRAKGRMATEADDGCTPKNVEPSDFPVRYVFNAAWRNLDEWVRKGIPAPHGVPLELRPEASKTFLPDAAFVEDPLGNARGGVRTPHVDVATARWIGAKSGPFRCLFYGYKLPFDAQKLKSLYGNRSGYVAKVRASVAELQSQRWLTVTDGAAIVREAGQLEIQ